MKILLVQHGLATSKEENPDRPLTDTGMRKIDGLNPNDDVQPYAENLVKQNGSFMVVGHLPFLEKLAALLVAGDPGKNVVSFVNSGVVCLEGEHGEWIVSWSLSPDLLFES